MTRSPSPSAPPTLSRRLLRGALDALVIAGLLSSTAGAIESRLDVALIAARVVERVSKTRVVQDRVQGSIQGCIRGPIRNVILAGELMHGSALRVRDSRPLPRIPAHARIPVLLSAH